MLNNEISVLLFEDNPGDALLVKEALGESNLATFSLECVDRLSDGQERLHQGGVDIILLDLALLDSFGMDTFTEVKAQAHDIPVVVFTSYDDETLAMRTIKEGGQDYIIKGQLDNNVLARSILYAIERQQIRMRLLDLSSKDELTGLCNRRGFYQMAEKHLKLAQRIKKDLLIVYADIDGMKQINDQFGHKNGDNALIKMGEALKVTFRESDVIARIGGDEFAVIALDADERDSEAIRERLQKNIVNNCPKDDCPVIISISLGVAYFDPHYPSSFDKLLHEADKMMYAEKRLKSIVRKELKYEAEKAW